MNKILKYLIWGFIALLVIFAVTGAGLWYVWSSNLPYIGTLRDYNPPIITEIYSADGHVIGRLWKEKRIVVPLDQMPDNLINAFVAAEDGKFFEHRGVDIFSIARAFIKNQLAGKKKQGASTITQQVARLMLLKTQEKLYERKVREVLLSLQIEKNFSKDRILFLYLNHIYLGGGAYGVEAAARTYFDKSVLDLNLAECAMLGGLYQAPSRYSPATNFDLAKTRQKYTLDRMVNEGFITESQKSEALETPIIMSQAKENTFEKSPYFTEHIRRYLEQQYGRDLLYEGGLRVYTTVNLEMQKNAWDAISMGLYELDKREGFRGAPSTLSEDEIDEYRKKISLDLAANPPQEDSVVEGIVLEINDADKFATVAVGNDMCKLSHSAMSWARKPDPDTPYYSARLNRISDVLGPGDVIKCRIIKPGEDDFKWHLALEQEPEVQGALFALETKTGKVRAMAGGRDFSNSQFNRAIQSRRQPGSAFKPIIYATALEFGMTPATIILDTPYVSSMNPDEDVWRPKNYAEKFFGPTLFRNSLINSRNVITVKILKQIKVQNVIDYARKLGIESDLTPDLSLALGSSGLSLKEITTSYSAFANNGVLVEPFFIERIEDRRGQIIEENQPLLKDVIPDYAAYIMTDLLKAVVEEGTGWRARELQRPAAGKTGTTNDLRDAWFIGYTPELLTGVWVGYDDQRSMGKGETGSRAASPIWLNFMKEALKGQPVQDFVAPDSVVFAKIDAEKGLLASPYSKKTVFQSFKKGTEPTEYTQKPETPKAGQFQQFDMSFPE